MVEQQQPPQQISEQEKRDYSLDRLSEAFETSARRWELIVYPSLFAFIILAGYGFFLIYSLATDVHYLAISVDSNMTVLASNMQSVSDNMTHMTANIKIMATNLTDINRKVGTLEPMLTSINSMDQSMGSMERSIQSITVSTHNMRSDMAIMNQNVSRPMSFMNTFLPW
jgi:uncharacterized protein YoxC